MQYGTIYARRKLVVSIEIPSKDKSYQWFLRWMSENVTSTQHLSIATSFEKSDNGNVKTKIGFLPSVGNHYLKYKGSWIRVERIREKSAIDLQSGGMWETVTLTMLGRDKQLLLDLLNEAKQLALKEEEGHTIIYTSYGPEWRPFGNPRKKRPLTSVILDGELTPQIVEDVQEFCENPGWYLDRGIPFRRLGSSLPCKLVNLRLIEGAICCTDHLVILQDIF